MVKEKRILSYILGWLIIGFCILFIGVNNVFAEEITPIEMKSQIRTIYTDGSTQWYTSGNNTYTTPLYFGTGPTYSTYGIPCNFRLNVISNIDNSYSYKYSYDMHIFTPFSTTNTWDSSKIDENYIIDVRDDQGVVKDSKCTIINTTKNTNLIGTFMNKTISCVFSVNKSQNDAYISAGYSCKGNCNLTNMEPLGFIPQDSYISIDNVKIERFNDNSNIIIDQNQTIIDQNNTTNEKLDDVQQSIIDSNKETQDVIKDQFNECKQSENLINYNNFSNINSNTSINIINNGLIIIKANNSNGYGIYSETLTLKPNTTYTISSNSNWEIEKPNNWGWRLYNVTDEIFSNISKNDNLTFTTNNNTQYILYYYIGSPNTDIGQVTLSNIMLNEGSSPKSYQPYGEEICSNRIDETNDKLNNIQGALTDSSSPNTSGLENSAGWLPAGPLDSILNLPLTMLNSLTNSLGKTCTPLNLTLPYVNKNIQIPCLSAIFAQITGVNGLWTWVGTIASVLILYNYLLNLYAWVDRVLTLRAEFDEAMGADMANWGRL